MITLYRAVSKAEKEDFDRDKHFRTGRNTLEVKEFFESEEGVNHFIDRTKRMQYDPPCDFLLHVKIDKQCLGNILYTEMELDGFTGIAIHENDLFSFNKCIKFVEY